MYYCRVDRKPPGISCVVWWYVVKANWRHILINDVELVQQVNALFTVQGSAVTKKNLTSQFRQWNTLRTGKSLLRC